MKKFAVIIATLSLLSLVGCQKEALEEQTATEPEVTIITAWLGNPDAKTTLADDGKTPQWTIGDKIRLIGNMEYQIIEVVEGSGTPEAGYAHIDGDKIIMATTVTGSRHYAVYPDTASYTKVYQDNVGGSQIYLKIPGIQDGTFGSANICMAVSDDAKENFYFTNMGAVLEVSVPADTKIVRVFGTNPIAGIKTVRFSAMEMNTSNSDMNGYSVSATLPEPAAAGTKVYLAVDASETAGDFTFTYIKDDGMAIAKKTGKTLSRNKIYAIDHSGLTFDTGEHTGQHGIIDGHEYVMVNVGTENAPSYARWAVDNVCTTESGAREWKTSGRIIGDYYKWGATSTIYSSFVASECFEYTHASANPDHKFKFLGTEQFADTYPSSHADVATAVWGDGWRMPSACYNYCDVDLLIAHTWQICDSKNLGVYFFEPDETHAAGKQYLSKEIADCDRSKALLFFPAAGYALNAMIYAPGEGHYWCPNTKWSPSSGSLYFKELNSTDGYKINIYSSDYNQKYYGYPVRPIAVN